MCCEELGQEGLGEVVLISLCKGAGGAQDEAREVEVGLVWL